MEFTKDDLRAIIGLCELDHKVTDLIGPRTPLPDMIQHRYRVSAVASKANILLMQILAEEERQLRASLGADSPAPRNGASAAP